MKPCKYLLPAFCVLAATTARADIKTTHEMSMNGKPISKTTRYVRKGAERTETTFSVGNYEQKTITVTLCDQKQMFTLNPDLKLYTVTPLVAAPAPNAKPQVAAGQQTGTMTMTLVNFKELGEETIGDTKTRCYEVTTRMQTSGCMGDMDTTMRQQICVAPGEATDGGGGCGLVAADNDGGTANACQTTTERKGDWSSYDKIMSGLQVRSRVLKDAGDEAQTETVLTMVSRAKLGDEWFVIPEDFKKVSSQEMQAAQTKAMIEKMQAGAAG